MGLALSSRSIPLLETPAIFRGSIPAEMQSIVHEHVRQWRVADIFVGCSGNFTVERCLADLGHQSRHHGNDVTLYSCAIGHYLAHQPFRLAVRDEFMSRYQWVSDEMGDLTSNVATILLFSRLAPVIGREDHPYHGRMLRAHAEQWPELMEKTRAKVKRCQVELESFSSTDVVDWVDGLDHAGGLIVYPPFMGGDYESSFAPLDRLFDWDQPAFTEFSDERLELLIVRAQTFNRWLLGLKKRIPELERHLRGVTRTVNRGIPIYVYSAHGPIRQVQPRQVTVPVLVARLEPGQEIGGRMTLHPLKGEQFYSLRSQYMCAGIVPGSPTFAVGVCVDGRLIGSFAISQASAMADWTGKLRWPWCYMLSDFPVAPTDYPRLSKLVLYAALSHEARVLVERSMSSRVWSVVTTAYSQNPTSMKYRGLFDVLNRKEQPATDGYYGQRFQINYGSSLGRWSLGEALAEWKRRHGKRRAQDAAA